MRDILKNSGIARNRRGYNGIVFDTLDDYNPFYNAPASKKVKGKPKEYTCPMCGSKFSVYRKALSCYVYKQFDGGKYRYFCSWTCLQKFRNKKEVK